MAVSIYSEADLRLIAGMDGVALNKLVSTQTVNQALIMRRNLHITLSDYSKKNPATKRLDQIQGAIIYICGMLERAARNAFTITAWRKVKRSKESMTDSEKLSEKIRIKGEWEKLLARMSY